MKTQALTTEKIKVNILEIAKGTVIALLSFFMGAGSLLGALSPFSIALVAALPIKYSFTAAVGGILSSFIFKTGGRPFYYIAIITIILLLRLGLHKFFKVNLKAFVGTLLATSICTISGVAYIMWFSPTPFVTVMLALEIILVATFSYFFTQASSILVRSQKISSLNFYEKAGLSAVLFATVVSLSSISVFHVNIGVVLSCIAVLVLTQLFGLSSACISSVLLSGALLLSAKDMAPFCWLLIFSAFIGGIFSFLGKWALVSSFIGMAVFWVTLNGFPILLTYHVIALFIGTAIAILLPVKKFSSIQGDKIKHPAAHFDQDEIKDCISKRLDFAAQTVSDLERELSTVSGKFIEIDNSCICSITDAAADKVCKSCAKKLYCWDDNYSDTVSAFNPISDILRTTGELKEESLPPYFAEQCIKTEQLCAAMNGYYERFVNRQNKKRQVAESRKILLEQFASMSQMLCEAGEEISDIECMDDALAETVKKAYLKLEYPPEKLLCYKDKTGRICVEIYTDTLLKTSQTALCENISAATEISFSLPTITTANGKTKISFFEQAKYDVEFSSQQSVCGNNSVCGDSFESFYDSKGYLNIMLSDGMGNGKRAAIDSVMTCSMLSKLLKSGIPVEAAVKLIGSSLLVKSADESMATLDLLKIDLYTGDATLYKAGSATTFIYTKGVLKRISSAALPVGILQGELPDKNKLKLHNGDIVLLVSDGATVMGESYICEELKKYSNRSAKEISMRICYEAKRKVSGCHDDDITVLAARISKADAD